VLFFLDGLVFGAMGTYQFTRRSTQPSALSRVAAPKARIIEAADCWRVLWLSQQSGDRVIAVIGKSGLISELAKNSIRAKLLRGLNAEG
jgi:hypothetical protein